MPSLSQFDLEGRLAALIAEHEVRGAGVAILLDDDIRVRGGGEGHAATQVEIPDRRDSFTLDTGIMPW